MINLNGYEKVDALQEGEYKKLPAGGYVCIVTAASATSTKTGKPMLVISFDIAEGRYKNLFAGRDNKPTLYQLIFDKEGGISPYFKGMLTNFEKSNTGFKIPAGDFDEKELRGKYIGVLFGAEEFVTREGDIRVAVKPKFTLSVDKVRDNLFTVPALKRVQRRQTFSNIDDDFAGNEISDEKLPF